ncbi:nucleotidyltransferase family protein [Xanthomonas hortorum]|uniref:nucleotidyltransferase domain-containing protein n=1 Tax=Xanthomonas hortorum TaxID=56454 RepID=UPI0001FD56A4|nr:nucleotidyltransferase domain-containing protein [Xanthomonas hortorum]EGD17608.1 hypothetical protein XGA_3784 [Xanthomonas hortorum ATCC 19865]KLA94813.1 hypothetical protein SM17710_19070 [Xanthomonas hortorum pv. gardneri]KLA97307.1 hypothetical protein SM19410_10705 [Xanthomonas hortorum pv. gardneri]KLB04502.1 hypothetical protein SM18210_07050 [Xanthomonas hortorum pv. gardneri]KLB08982.1 hypothetical protein SM23410_13290 [Xanthomonas hortorum pv. gardneri]
MASFILRTCASLRHFEPYMFGSSLSGIGSDFDILIIGPNHAPLSELKAEMRMAAQALPLDVLYMLPEEQHETSFINLQGCVSLHVIASLY